ncbi:N5-glutamine S-adenosyl-L-methionine-dependent methyltransferase [Marichromatium purpuratum 984]|uniref:Release factor glutamine methyltransferase n=1 Tax=Marichromatium purpuratum 984 TaxID=765910 RepID=W0E1S1_MARPU|nr:peptide chain release factor N(5)-glutamine methyltransferase [Marichromatium purpuratum]AHF03056.1 N5-glutamine S-adenosyl-L-methionine-dependent methyltransferase [Marichromatium purpuratum 984]
MARAPSPATFAEQRTDEILTRAAAALGALAGAAARLEAELLLEQCSGWSRTSQRAWPERRLDATTATAFAALLGRRLDGEPIAYIRGTQAFWTLELGVTPDTLIPRPETELLVETALARGPAGTATVLDLGTGSGAIALALASERPRWRITATDRSGAALAVARANRDRLGLEVDLVTGDWLGAVATGSCDLILSNPPYIDGDDPHLDLGDLRFEPPGALTPGADGLAAIRTILAEAPRCLRPGGWLMVEHGCDQGVAARALFGAAGLVEVATLDDLAGLDRITLGRR